MSSSRPPVAKFSCDSEFRPSEGREEGTKDLLNKAPQCLAYGCHRPAVAGAIVYQAAGFDETLVCEEHLKLPNVLQISEIVREGRPLRSE